MSSPSLASLLADLRHAFPNPSIDQARLDLYLRELADVPLPVLAVAVRTAIRGGDYFPRISELRRLAAEHVLALPSEDEALRQVYARQEWGRRDEADRGDPPPIHPLVKEALDLVGGWAAFRTADEPTILRGQYLRIFREMSARAVRDVQLGTVPIERT